jgi:hypothetical protein
MRGRSASRTSGGTCRGGVRGGGGFNEAMPAVTCGGHNGRSVKAAGCAMSPVTGEEDGGGGVADRGRAGGSGAVLRAACRGAELGTGVR